MEDRYGKVIKIGSTVVYTDLQNRPALGLAKEFKREYVLVEQLSTRRLQPIHSKNLVVVRSDKLSLCAFNNVIKEVITND